MLACERRRFMELAIILVPSNRSADPAERSCNWPGSISLLANRVRGRAKKSIGGPLNLF